MTSVLTVGELAEIVGGEVVRGDAARPVHRVMPTDRAEADAVTFVTDLAYLEKLKASRAAAVMLAPAVYARAEDALPPDMAVISVEGPYVAYAIAAQRLAPPLPEPAGVHATATVEDGATVAPDARLGPHAFVGAGAEVGAGAVLHAGAHVHAGARVGPGTVLHDHVVVRHGCTVGARCILHAGVVIGADGFGFAPRKTPDGVEHVKIPQLGDVVVEDDVEIGANACIDRGALGTTRVGRGTKIDNLVQVGHNVTIGPGGILVAQCGVAGSSHLGEAVTLGAQCGISGHLKIGDGSLVHGQAGVMQDLPPKSTVVGAPAVDKRAFFRTVVQTRKLSDLFDRVKRLERALARTLGDDT